MDKYRVTITLPMGTVIFDRTVEAECSMEVLSLGGREECNEKGWDELRQVYFGNERGESQP